MTLRRYPNGADGKSFFEKRCPSHRPDWVPVALGPGDHNGQIGYCRLDSVAALAWSANLAALEIHAPMARAGDIETPTMVVFDLDPGEPATIVECCRVALADPGGARRRSIWSPSPRPAGRRACSSTCPSTRPAPTTRPARSRWPWRSCSSGEDPKGVTSTMAKAVRPGKIFVDWSQNTRHKTTIAPYSLRARPRPTVSTPLTWDEVEAGAGGDAPSFEAAEVLERVARHGDLFAETLTLCQALPELSARQGAQRSRP